MKRKVFSLMMGLILAFTGLVRADELTVNDGSATNSYIPIYGYWADMSNSYTDAQFILPGSDLADMNGTAITALTFYANYNQNFGAAVFDIYMQETVSPTMSSLASVTGLTPVYSGNLAIASNQLVITLTNPYEYNGGNLLVTFHKASSGSCSSSSADKFYGVSASIGASGYYNSSFTTQSFLPKVTFTYSGGGGTTCPLVVTPDTIDLGARPNRCWMRPFVVELTNNGPATYITGIDFDNNYFTRELGELVIPFAIDRNETVEFEITTGVGNGDMVSTLDVDYDNLRTAVLFDVMAYAYDPVEPDVWEKARVIRNAEDYRDNPTTVTLYNNYVLPPADVEDGNDAVYKMTIDHDMMLNGNVVKHEGVESAENGKLVVYTQAGIDAVGGPDLENNYTGPTIGSSEPMEMTVYPEGLTGTTTVGTLPMYGLYADAYTRSQYVIPATEIAAMAGCPINSLTYYASSTPEPWTGASFQVYLKEVSSTGVSSFIDPATATTVYSGELTVADNQMVVNFATPYQYNGGNLLIGMDCTTTGTYHSCYFQCVSMTGAGMYAYNYSAPTFTSPYAVNYAPTTTFGYMGRGSNRAEEVVFSDDFESGAATGWTIENEDEYYSGWTLAASDGHSHYAQGSYAMFDLGNSSGYYNDLYSPSIDLTNATSATLSFDYINPQWINDYNYLYVYAYVPAEDYFYSLGEPTAPMASWTTITYDLTPYCGKEIQINFYDDFEYGYCTGIDNFVVTAEMGVPVPPVPGDQLITNMTMLPGTYYIAASSTEDAWDVILNASELPCPDEITEANCVEPADDAYGINPSSVTLKWHLSPYTTEYRLVFGSTYYCENVLVDWTRDLRESYTVTGLFNNTNYFWRIEERNDGCPQGVQGPVWGFTTTFNAPTNLHSTNANGNNIYEGETLHLAWTPIVDRTFRSYNIYMDGDLIGTTPSNPDPNATTTFDVEGLTYEMGGHVFNVTAVYDEGESWISNDLVIYVSGEGNVEGYVYELDGVTGIAGATVTITNVDEFGRLHTYTFTTDENGYYTGAILAGECGAVATCTGYQDEAYENNPFQIVYNELTPDINFIMDEVFAPVGEVIAEYYPDPEDPESPYVKVYWGWNVMSSIIEDFETGDFSQFEWNIPAQYPFEITANNPYEGAYCMQSTNYNVSSSTSSIDVTVEIPRAGLMSFYERVSCESSWDNAYFYIDGVQKGTYTGTSNWTLKEYEVTEGTHNFKWEYTKDGSVNSGEDRFYIDYIDFIHDAQPLEPGWIYYDNGVNVDAIGLTAGGSFMWGVRFPASMMSSFSGCSLTKVSLFDYEAHTGNVMIYQGGATAPGTLIHQQPYTCTGSNDFVETTLTSALPIDPTQDLWVVMNNDNGQYVASACDDTGDPNGRFISIDGVEWDDVAALGLPYTWMIRAYVSDGAKSRAISSDDAISAIKPEYNLSGASLSDLTIDPAQTEPVVTGQANSNDRSFQYFRVYRTDCYNDGPYTPENTVVCCCELHDTLYIDVEWPELPAGVYKWGVGCVYGGNRESEITWANVAVPANMTESNLPANIDKDRMAPVVAVRNTPAKIRHNDNMNRDSFRGTTAYGCNVYGTVIPTGLFSMDIDNPTGASLLSTMALNACEYVDGMLYAYTDDAFMTIDPATGSVNSQVAVTDYPTEMAYDYSSNTMYAYSAGVLYTINMTTGAMTQVALVMNEEGTNIGVSGLAATLDGTLYAMGTGYAYLYTINKATGDATYVGGDGVNDDLWPYYLSSGAIDYATNTMYWENSDYMGPDELYAVDLTTGAATFVCNFVETLGLTFEHTAAPVPPTPPTPGTGLQEPRESEIVWSNCLDKDMYINGGVDITVLLNSADSPEGVNVSFTNLNEGEQELYPIAPVTLDSTGYYAWDTFRRGNYVLNVTMGDAYEPITDTVRIWDATSLRYVMIEIIYGVNDLYVSHTGWAMWDGQEPGPVPPTPGEEFTFGFEEDPIANGWTIQQLNETSWVRQEGATGFGAAPHEGNYHMWLHWAYGDQDEWLITPEFTVPANGNLNFWTYATLGSTYGDHYYAKITVDGGNTWNVLWDATAQPAGENQYTSPINCDLSAYAGQTAKIAWQGVMADGLWYAWCIDDITVSGGREVISFDGRQWYRQETNTTEVGEPVAYSKAGDVEPRNGERHLEGYKVLCTSIDGEPIFSGNTVHPFIQVDTEELVEGENYICKVAAIYSTGMSDWTEAIWQYKSCENYGEAQDVEAEGNTVNWNYPSGPVPPPPGPGDEFSFSFDSNADGWTTINADGDDHNWYHSSQADAHSTLAITSHSGAGHMMSESYCNATWAALTPDEYLVTPQMYSIAAGSTFSFWACAQDENYAAEHFGVAISTTGNTSAADFTTINEWTLTAKGGAKANPASTRNGEGTREGAWHQYTVDLSAYAGQNVYIAIRHFGCSDMFIMCMDDAQLTAGAKSGERHLEYYKVLCTSIDSVPIYNHNTVVPMCQLDTNDPYQAPLVEGDHYLVKVACMYSTGMSAWSEPVEWVYEPCDHWGPVDYVDLNTIGAGNHISWEFTQGFNPYDPVGPVPPTPGDTEFSFSFDSNADGWTTINADGDDHNWYHSSEAGNHSTLAITSHTGAGHMMSESYCNATWAALHPDEYLVTPQMYSIVNGSTFSFWACAQDASYAAEHFGVAISTTGNTSAADFTTINEWTLTAKGNGKFNPAATRDGEGTREGNWYQYTCDLSAYAGQNVYIAIRHFGCSDMFIMCMDDAQLTAGAKGATAFESGMTGNAYAFNITDVANFDERVYVLYNLYNDVRFDIINGEADGMFMISAAAGYEDMDLEETINDFMFQSNNQFRMMDKVQAADVAREYKASLPTSFANSLMMDLYVASRQNNLCETADPFCTDNGMYEFPAGVDAGSGENGPYYDCLYTTPNPAWYYMKMSDPGDMDIYMYSTPGEDIDFCCWGPFADPTSECPNGLTSDKVVSCSYSAAPTEHCMIPATAQTGEYYILVITNYSNSPCNINFSKVAGSGSTDCSIMPDVDIIGFLITLDGEYLDIVGPEVREYTHEGEFGDHIYCVRPIYPGEMNLPDHNYGWSMGCPVCSDEPVPPVACDPGEPIRGEYVWNNANDFGALISWGEQVEPIGEWLYYDDGTYATSVGAGGTLYWGSMFPASALTPYAGCSLTQVAVCSSYPCTATLNVYYGGTNAPATLVHSQNVLFSGNNDFDEITLSAALPLDGENLWITFYQSGESYPADACNDTGDANNRWVSIDGNTWQDLAAAGLPGYGWMIRGYVTNMAKGGEVVALNPFKGNVGGELNHTAVVSIPTSQSFMNRAEIVKYNIYRSTDNVNYELIASVDAIDGTTYYEYFDATAAGVYYYQVRALYSNGCESEPAASEANPANNYVIVNVTSVAENGEIALYPNPTNGNITIQAQNMNRITVVSVLGQVVYDAEIDGDEYHINMAQFNAGVYMVRIATENGVSTQRVTVVK